MGDRDHEYQKGNPNLTSRFRGLGRGICDVTEKKIIACFAEKLQCFKITQTPFF